LVIVDLLQGCAASSPPATGKARNAGRQDPDGRVVEGSAGEAISPTATPAIYHIASGATTGRRSMQPGLGRAWRFFGTTAGANDERKR
jgi:hypothetical protein